MPDAGKSIGSWSVGETPRATEDFENFNRVQAPGWASEYDAVPNNPMFNLRDVLRIPRLWKPAVAGYASGNSLGTPMDGGQGGADNLMLTTPHVPIRRLTPDTRSGLSRSGDALKAGSPGRIPPVLVRAAR